jgi:hypothetical protein
MFLKFRQDVFEFSAMVNMIVIINGEFCDIGSCNFRYKA